MSLTRRDLLARASAVGAVSMIPVLSGLSSGCTSSKGKGDTDGNASGDGDGDGDGDSDGDGGELGPENLFEHGIASGDPLADAVILWTALSPAEDVSEAIEVEVEVATDPDMSDMVLADTFEATAERAWTLKVDAVGLSAATTYYYRFRAQGRTSAIGRTRTAASGATEHLRFGVASCSNYNFGYFHGYRQLAARADLDAVLHLGDYIYEYGPKEYGSFRTAAPNHEIVTLEDYRTRYSTYRKDPDLAAVHQQHPFITIWDDHEITNDAWKEGAENHNPDEGEGDYAERLAVARQVYDEWMPYREGVPGEIYRALNYGDLVDLIMLDTRIHGRDEQADPAASIKDDPDRQLLGTDQEQWLLDQLSNSTAKWKIIGQQVVMTPVYFGGNPINGDQWDGYSVARDTILGHIESNGIDNVVVLTGDIHSSWANDLPRDVDAYDPDTQTGSVAVEFVTPGITSPGLDDDAFNIGILGANPNVRYVDVTIRGYMVLDVTATAVQADWYHYTGDDIREEGVDPTYERSYRVDDGVPYAVEASGEASEKADAPPLAPTT